MRNEFDESKYPGQIDRFHHGVLDKDCKINRQTGRIRVNEKRDPSLRTGRNPWIEYSGSEADILRSNGGIDKNTHLVKKVFDGEIIEYNPQGE